MDSSYILESDILELKGLIQKNVTINLVNGWNLVSSPYTTTKSVTEAMESLDGCYVNILNYNNSIWYSYSPTKPFNTLNYIYPGKGYWIRVNCTEVDWVVT